MHYSYLLAILKSFSFFGYIIIFILTFFESFAFIGLIIPGSVAVIIGGFLAAQGTMDVGYLFIFAILGAILGDSFSFYLGKKRLIKFKQGNKIFKPKLLEKGEDYFKKHGSKSVFWGRFIGWVRPIVPFVTGLFNLDRKVFIVWNILSGLLWAIVHIGIGYFFGKALFNINLWSTKGGIFIIYLSVFLIIFYLLKWLIFKKGKQLWLFLKSICRSIQKAIINNFEVQKLIKKHPKFFNFLHKRLNRDKFSGLPLTLLFLAFIYILSLFVGVIEDIITTDTIVLADTHIANLFAMFRSVEATNFFFWVTVLGKWQVIFCFLLILIVVLWTWRKRIYIIPLLITVGGAEFFTALAKIIFHRPRPIASVYIEHSFSFPSGHSTIAVAFYGFLAYLIIRNVKRWKVKVNIFFSALILILLIGFSRLYLGVHYVSDIWGGYLVGVLWLIIGISIMEWWLAKNKQKINSLSPKSRLSSTKKYLISIFLILSSLLFYVHFGLNYNPQRTSPLIERRITVDKNIDNIFTTEQLKYTETLIGEKQEPISFIIFANNDRQLIQLFEKANWFLADQPNIFSVLKLAQAVILKQADQQAPMTPSFWDSEVNNFGFEKATKDNNARERHHARFWKTKYILKNSKRIYIGTASLDDGMKWGITHKINPDIDTERETIFKDLQSSGLIKSFQKEKFVKPTLGKNFSGDLFFTDGEVYLIYLK